MTKKLNLNEIKEEALSHLGYIFNGLKILTALGVTLFNAVELSFVYFLLDLLGSAYSHYQDKKEKDLSNDNFEMIKSSSSRLQKSFDKLAKTQQEYERERKIKENSLKLLNKLIAEGLIRGKDLLNLGGSSRYFQLFVYSASLTRIAKPLGVTQRREYPIFLESLGFVRLGKNSSLFLVSKSRLGNKKLQHIKNMKQFLLYHFKRLRKTEWDAFLAEVKKKDLSQFSKLNKRSYAQWGYLKYNFLLTETDMNPTNIGFVDNEYIGLASVYDNQAIINQILEKPTLRTIEINEELKVKIKKIIEKLDITLLLEGIERKIKDMIDLKQDIIKEALHVNNVIDFHKINANDLSVELIKIDIPEDKAKEIATQIVETTIIYKKALEELNI